MAGVCYQQCIEEQEDDENSLQQDEKVSWSQILILTADFSYPDIRPVYMIQEISRLWWWNFPSTAAGEAN